MTFRQAQGHGEPGRTMKIFVLDASVTVNYLITLNSRIVAEFSSILEEARRGKASLHSSYLLPFEAGNALRYSSLTPDQARIALEKLSALPLNYFVFNAPQLTEIMEKSFLLKTTFYDTSYHFLALLLGGTFLTADQDYFKKARNLGNIELV